MIHFLTQRFIENYDDYKNQKVRQAYGTLCSILSIICNIVLVIFKITIGLIVRSVAIQADGLNNLSDVGSNLASLFGCRNGDCFFNFSSRYSIFKRISC